MSSDIHRTIDAVWRVESARLIASLTRIVRDVGMAEDLAQGALLAALEQWPNSGVPDKPGAWLMTTAKHHAIDQIRRNARLERKQEELGRELERQQELEEPDLDVDSEEELGDDLLRLIFIACHPVLEGCTPLLPPPAWWPDNGRDRPAFSSLSRPLHNESCGKAHSLKPTFHLKFQWAVNAPRGYPQYWKSSI
jgi:hypothetical protein